MRGTSRWGYRWVERQSWWTNGSTFPFARFRSLFQWRGVDGSCPPSKIECLHVSIQSGHEAASFNENYAKNVHNKPVVKKKGTHLQTFFGDGYFGHVQDDELGVLHAFQQDLDVAARGKISFQKGQEPQFVLAREKRARKPPVGVLGGSAHLPGGRHLWEKNHHEHYCNKRTNKCRSAFLHLVFKHCWTRVEICRDLSQPTPVELWWARHFLSPHVPRQRRRRRCDEPAAVFVHVFQAFSASIWPTTVCTALSLGGRDVCSSASFHSPAHGYD